VLLDGTGAITVVEPVPELAVTCAEALPPELWVKKTRVLVPLKFVPVIVIELPLAAEAGTIPVIVGVTIPPPKRLDPPPQPPSNRTDATRIGDAFNRRRIEKMLTHA